MAEKEDLGEATNLARTNDPEPHLVQGNVPGFISTPEPEPETNRESEVRRELNQAVHRMLILGLILSTAALLAGLGLSVISHRRLPSKVLGFGEIFAGLKTGTPAGFLSLGILLLIATPALRVFGSLVEFVRKRDWRYALVTSIVLIILVISAVIGGG